MSEFKRRGRSKHLFLKILCACCALLMLLTGVFDVRVPFLHSAVQWAVSPVQNFFSAASAQIQNLFQRDSAEELEAKVQSLEEENRALRDRITSLEAEAKRGRELESLYDLDTYYKEYPKTAAQIIGLSPSNWFDVFLIDKGEKDHLRPEMPVMTEEGIAGHIREVFEGYSVVVSITSAESSIYGEIDRSDGKNVVLQGAQGHEFSNMPGFFEDACFIRFQTEENTVLLGDRIITSALGDIYPPGLLLGTVTDIVPIGDGMESIAFVKPAADLKDSHTVLVITSLWREDLELPVFTDTLPSGGEEAP